MAVPSIQVLSGEFPANATQEYFGSAPSHVLAAWFAVAGPTSLSRSTSSRTCCRLLILWTSWLVLRRFLDRPAALLGLAVLAVPPLFVTQWSFTTAGNHPVVLVLGNLCLLATHRIFVEDPRRAPCPPRAWLARWPWLVDEPAQRRLPRPIRHPGAPDRARLAAEDRAVRRSGYSWRAARSGSDELWYFPSARFALQQAGGVAVPCRSASALALTSVASSRRLVGFQPQTGRCRGSPRSSSWLRLCGLPSSVAAAVRDHAELGWLLGRHGRLDRGQVILWIVVATNLALVLVTHRAIDHYYLLPLCSVLPCWAGEALSWIHGRSQLVAGAALAGLLALNVWTNWQGTLGSTDAGRIAGTGGRRWVALERRIQPLLRLARGPRPRSCLPHRDALHEHPPGRATASPVIRGDVPVRPSGASSPTRGETAS